LRTFAIGVCIIVTIVENAFGKALGVAGMTLIARITFARELCKYVAQTSEL